MAKNFLFSFFLIICFTGFATAQNTNTRKAAVRTAAGNAAMNASYEGENYIPPPPANSTIRGRIYYEDTGRPVKRASVMFLKTEENSPGEMSILTDGNGEFVIHNVKAGSYFAMVNAPGVVSPLAFLDISRNRGTDSGAMEEAAANFEKIVVDGVNEVVVQIPAKRGGAISGRIVYENGDPGIGVRVEVLRKTGGKYLPVISNLSSLMAMFSGGLGSGQADDRGMFRFSGLPAGEYIVKISESAQHTTGDKPGYGSQVFESLFFGGSSFLTFYFPDATDVKDAQVLNVLIGQELAEINITIPDKSLFILSGKIVSMKDKKPLAHTRVSLQKKSDNVVSLFGEIGRNLNTAVTDEEGNWDFKDLPKGDYWITVEPYNDNEYGYYGAVNTNMNAGNGSVIPPKGPPKPKFAKTFKNFQLEDKDLTDVIIELGYGAVISGTVSAEDNKEMPKNVTIVALGERDEVLATTSLWNYQDEHAGPPAPQKAYNDFKLENIATGKINLRFNVGDDDFYVKSARSGMVDLLTTPLDVKEGDVLANVKVVLASDVGTLKGKVIDSKDIAAGGVSILLVPMEGAKKRSPQFFKNTRSDIEGKFEMKLPPGEYAVILVTSSGMDGGREELNKWLDEAMKTASKVTIQAEKTETITIKKPAK